MIVESKQSRSRVRSCTNGQSIAISPTEQSKRPLESAQSHFSGSIDNRRESETRGLVSLRNSGVARVSSRYPS